MVLVKMLMEISLSDERSDGDDFPLPEGSIPGRTALPELQIGSPKAPPRGGGVSSRKVPSYFFLIEKPHIGEDGVGEPPGGPRGRGRALGGGRPHPREQGVGPLTFIFGEDFSLFILRCSMEFQDFWSCAE